MGTSSHEVEAPTTVIMPAALLMPGAFGPWMTGVPEPDHVAGLRALAALVAVFAGSDHPTVDALRRAEADVTASGEALAAFDGLAAKQQRNVIATYCAIMLSAPAAARRIVIVLVIAAAGTTTRGPTFNGTVDDAAIVTRSTTPFCDAARTLLAQGMAPDTPFVMRHAGQTHDALRATVGVAAGLSVGDRGGKPTFRTYKPYNGRSRMAVGRPMPPATDQSSGAAELNDASTTSPAHEFDGGPWA